MDFSTGIPNHIEDVLVQMHTGQWFGWSDSKDKVYSNLVILDDQYSKPTKASLESALAQAQIDCDWIEVRNKRDALLAASDHVLMPDYPMEDKSAWESYRQELRDIPQAYSDIEEIAWPEDPEE